jgi:hypothetical protein
MDIHCCNVRAHESNLDVGVPLMAVLEDGGKYGSMMIFYLRSPAALVPRQLVKSASSANTAANAWASWRFHASMNRSINS